MPNYVNEPIDARRVIWVFLVDNLNFGKAGQAGAVTIKIAKNGGNWIASTATIAEVTGGAAGSYRISFPVGEWDTEGPFGFQVTGAAIALFEDGVDLTVYDEGPLYFKATGGAAGYVQGPATLVATDDYYAGSAGQCLVGTIIAGTGVGQTRLMYDYIGATKRLSVIPDWNAGAIPDATSIVKTVPYVGQLDASVITAIRAGIATTAALTAVAAQATAIQADTTAIIAKLVILGGLLHHNTMIDNVTFGSGNMLTLWRVRAFDTKAHKDAATPGNVGLELGELVRFEGSAVDEGGGTWSSMSLTQTP